MKASICSAYSTTIAVAFLSMAFVSCHSRVDYTATKACSDSFLSDLDADRLNDALNRLEPEFIQLYGRDKIIGVMRNVSVICGRPLTRTFQRDEIGVYFYLDGRKKPTRRFYYDTFNAKHPEARCTFDVTVVSGDQGDYRVVSFNANRPPLR